MIIWVLGLFVTVFGVYVLYWLLVKIAVFLGFGALLLGGGWLVSRVWSAGRGR